MTSTRHRPILFLDVDGVLNRCGLSSQGLETDKVELLRQILQATGAAVVLSSTWRNNKVDWKRFRDLSRKLGFVWLGGTPNLDTQALSGLSLAKTRPDEIRAWLALNPGICRCAILDDEINDELAQELAPALVKTESFVGLTAAHAKRCIELLSDGRPLPVKWALTPVELLDNLGDG